MACHERFRRVWSLARYDLTGVVRRGLSLRPAHVTIKATHAPRLAFSTQHLADLERKLARSMSRMRYVAQARAMRRRFHGSSGRQAGGIGPLSIVLSSALALAS